MTEHSNPRNWRRWERERELAVAIRTLLRETYRKPSGHCDPATWRTLARDVELTAFLHSCAEAGPNAWAEEVDRARNRRAVMAIEQGDIGPDAAPGSPELSLVAIGDLLPVWRAWGRMLLDAEASHAPSAKIHHGVP